MQEVVLARHPQSRGDLRLGIRAALRREGHALRVSYALEGELGRVRLPASASPRFAGELWKHTCLELFLALRGAHAYHEFNFSPSGEWAVYAFAAYREPVAFDVAGFDPAIALRESRECLQLDAGISLERLSAAHAREALAVGVSAVIEQDDGALSYWALAHPPGKPDFHHPDSFAVMLE